MESMEHKPDRSKNLLATFFIAFFEISSKIQLHILIYNSKNFP